MYTGDDCGIVILNWNGFDDTMSCIDSILKGVCLPRCIVICDNGSTDGSVGFIKEFLDKKYSASRVEFVFLCSDSNLGYAAGVNMGARYLVEKGIDYVMILNNDVLLSDDSLAALVEYVNVVPGSNIVGSTVIRGVDGLIEAAGGCRYNKWTSSIVPLHAGQGLSLVGNLNEVELDYVYGCCIFVSSNVFLTLGYFNEDFFLFYEELDFCTRAKNNGFKLQWCKNSIVKHQGGVSRRKLEISSFGVSDYHENLSCLIFTWKFYPLIFPFVFVKRLFGRSLRMILNRRLNVLFVLFRAYFDFIKGSYRPGR